MPQNEVKLARDVPAGPGRIIRIQLIEYKDENYVDIRYWLEIDEDMKATPKGIRFNADELLGGVVGTLNGILGLLGIEDEAGDAE